MGAVCSSEQGYDSCGPSRPQLKPYYPKQNRPEEVPKSVNDVDSVDGAAERNPKREREQEYHSNRNSQTHQKDGARTQNYGSTRQKQTQSIRQATVRIERKLWGLPNPEEPQDIFNANVPRASGTLRGTAKRMFRDMTQGSAPSGENTRGRANGKVLTSMDYLEAMSEKRREFYEKQAEKARVREAARKAEEVMEADEPRRVEEPRAAEDGTAAHVGDTVTSNRDDEENILSGEIGHSQGLLQNDNDVSLNAIPSLNMSTSQNNDENVPPSLDRYHQECMQKNKITIENMKSDMRFWLKMNILCYDIRHYNVTIESQKRADNCRLVFTQSEAKMMDQLLVPFTMQLTDFVASKHEDSFNGDGMVVNFEQLMKHLKHRSRKAVNADGTNESWKISFYDDLAPYLEYALGIFDGGQQLENRLWFLQLMEKFGSPIPAQELAKWDEKMSGVYGMGDEMKTTEVASRWRVAPCEMKHLSEWIDIITKESKTGHKATSPATVQDSVDDELGVTLRGWFFNVE